jgi:hypothetical protein
MPTGVIISPLDGIVFLIKLPDWAKSRVLTELPNATAVPAPALSAWRLEIVIYISPVFWF